MVRSIILSAGISCLLGGLIFMYFRNRITKVEKKVDLMFQLIQEYEQTKSNQMNNANQVLHENNNHNEDLILVSDDDDLSDNSDSDEVSDNEDDEDNTIHIDETSDINNIKSINLVEGAEINNSIYISNLNDINDLEKVKIEDSQKLLQQIQLNEDNTIDNNTSGEGGSADDVNETNYAATDEDLDNDATDDLDDVDDNLDEVDDNLDEVDDNLDNKINSSEETKPLGKYSVKELKNMCQIQGFTNYKALRKDKLIQLLQSE